MQSWGPDTATTYSSACRRRSNSPTGSVTVSLRAHGVDGAVGLDGVRLLHRLADLGAEEAGGLEDGEPHGPGAGDVGVGDLGGGRDLADGGVARFERGAGADGLADLVGGLVAVDGDRGAGADQDHDDPGQAPDDAPRRRPPLAPLPRPAWLCGSGSATSWWPAGRPAWRAHRRRRGAAAVAAWRRWPLASVAAVARRRCGGRGRLGRGGGRGRRLPVLLAPRPGALRRLGPLRFRRRGRRRGGRCLARRRRRPWRRRRHRRAPPPVRRVRPGLPPPTRRPHRRRGLGPGGRALPRQLVDRLGRCVGRLGHGPGSVGRGRIGVVRRRLGGLAGRSRLRRFDGAGRVGGRGCRFVGRAGAPFGVGRRPLVDRVASDCGAVRLGHLRQLVDRVGGRPSSRAGAAGPSVATASSASTRCARSSAASGRRRPRRPPRPHRPTRPHRPSRPARPARPPSGRTPAGGAPPGWPGPDRPAPPSPRRAPPPLVGRGTAWPPSPCRSPIGPPSRPGDGGQEGGLRFLGPVLGPGRRGPLDDRLQLRVAGAAGQEVPEHDRRGQDVGVGVGRRCARQPVEPEPHQPGHPVGGHHDAGGGDVPVDDALAVHRRQCPQHPFGQRHRLLRGQPTVAQDLPQLPAVDPVLHDPHPAAALHDLTDGQHVGVADLRQRRRRRPQAAEEGLVGGDRGVQLGDGDGLAGRLVPGPRHRAGGTDRRSVGEGVVVEPPQRSPFT